MKRYPGMCGFTASLPKPEVIVYVKLPHTMRYDNSGAPAARSAAKRSPILIWETKGNPWVDFLMVIMASGITRGRVRTTTSTTATTTVESRKMAAILQIIGWQRDMQLWFTVYFFGIGHSCYDQLTPVKTRYPLTSITWPYRGLKLTAHRGQVFWKVTVDQVLGFQLDRGLMSG